MTYKKVLKRIKQILTEKSEIDSLGLSWKLHEEGLIQAYTLLSQSQVSWLMNRWVKERRVIYEDEKIKVEHEKPEKLTWFYLKEGGRWAVLGYAGGDKECRKNI